MLRVWGCDLGGHHADVVRVARQPLDRLLHVWRATRTLRLLHAVPVLLDRICEGGARSPVSSCAGLAIRGASKGPSNTPGHHEAPSSVFLAKAEGGHFWALHARVTATSGESTRSPTPRNTRHPRRPPMGQDAQSSGAGGGGSLPKLGGDAKALLLEKWRGDLPGSSVRMVGISSSGPPQSARALARKSQP